MPAIRCRSAGTVSMRSATSAACFSPPICSKQTAAPYVYVDFDHYTARTTPRSQLWSISSDTAAVHPDRTSRAELKGREERNVDEAQPARRTRRARGTRGRVAYGDVPKPPLRGCANVPMTPRHPIGLGWLSPSPRTRYGAGSDIDPGPSALSGSTRARQLAGCGPNVDGLVRTRRIHLRGRHSGIISALRRARTSFPRGNEIKPRN